MRVNVCKPLIAVTAPVGDKYLVYYFEEFCSHYCPFLYILCYYWKKRYLFLKSSVVAGDHFCAALSRSVSRFPGDKSRPVCAEHKNQVYILIISAPLHITTPALTKYIRRTGINGSLMTFLLSLFERSISTLIFSQRRSYFEQIKNETHNIFMRHI